MRMTLNKISKILSAHCIEHKIVNTRIIAKEIYTCNKKTYENDIDLTDYSKSDLYSWLGY